MWGLFDSMNFFIVVFYITTTAVAIFSIYNIIKYYVTVKKVKIGESIIYNNKEINDAESIIKLAMLLDSGGEITNITPFFSDCTMLLLKIKAQNNQLDEDDDKSLEEIKKYIIKYFFKKAKNSFLYFLISITAIIMICQVVVK